MYLTLLISAVIGILRFKAVKSSANYIDKKFPFFVALVTSQLTICVVLDNLVQLTMD